MTSTVEEMYSTSNSPDEKCRKRRHSDNDYSDDEGSSPKSHSPSIDDDRRAHHNELERRRRDHIKDHFMCLKDAIPLLNGEKSSRALILKRAVEYINTMKARVSESQKSVEDLRRRNELLEEKLKEKPVDVSPPLLHPAPISPVATQMSPLVLPQFKPVLPPISASAAPIHEATSPVLGGFDPVQLGLLANAQENSLLSLAQALFGCAKIAPSLQKEPALFGSSFVLPDRQMTVRF